MLCSLRRCAVSPTSDGGLRVQRLHCVHLRYNYDEDDDYEDVSVIKEINAFSTYGKYMEKQEKWSNVLEKV